MKIEIPTPTANTLTIVLIENGRYNYGCIDHFVEKNSIGNPVRCLFERLRKSLRESPRETSR